MRQRSPKCKSSKASAKPRRIDFKTRRIKCMQIDSGCISRIQCKSLNRISGLLSGWNRNKLGLIGFKVGYKNRNLSCRNLQLAQVDLHYQKRLICTRLKRMTNQSLPMKEYVVHPRYRHVIQSRDIVTWLIMWLVNKRNGMNVKKLWWREQGMKKLQKSQNKGWK